MIKKSRSFVKGYKFPIYPTLEQESLLARTFGCNRFVYNNLLATEIEEYEKYVERRDKGLSAERPNVSGYSLAKKITSLKNNPEYHWLNEVSSVTLQQTALNLGRAFTNLFKNGAGFPKFKKRNQRQSFRLAKSGFTLKDGVLRIAKCKDPIKVVFSRDLPSEPTSITISKTASGKYYVSFVCEYLPEQTNGKAVVGIDLGISTLAALSTGEKIDNPKFYISAQKKLRRSQQSLSRKNKGSNNRNKARLKVAKQHERIANMRTNHLHQRTRELVNENQVIGIEGLKVRNMVRNKRLSKHIMDSGWGMFKQMLMYKVAESQHATLVMMDTYFPSSHICAATGERLNRKLTLSERKWDCPYCGQRHDRDINAAQVIASEALFATSNTPYDEIAGTVILADSYVGRKITMPQ